METLTEEETQILKRVRHKKVSTITNEEAEVIRKYDRIRYRKNPDRQQQTPEQKVYQNNWRRKQRYKIMQHYSGGTPKCAKCGITDIRVLSIDHINGGGRKQIIETHTSLPQWIVNHNYPDGFQILCMNCQFIKAAENKEWEQYEKKDD